MRLQFTHKFHSGRVTWASFRRATVTGESGNQRTSTPRKNSGEYRWFEKAAPYSKYGLNAPSAPPNLINVRVASKELLPTLESGNLVKWPGEIQAQLHHLGSYKPNQQNELFKEYVSLIRNETKDLWSRLTPGRSVLIEGDSGVGKTGLLTQAHAAAKLQGWATLHLSQTEKLLDGSSDAVFNVESKLWDQPMAMFRVWKKTVKANRSLLDNPKQLTPVKRLADMVNLFAQHKILVTVDNINALTHRVWSENTNEQNEKLYHNDLEAVNTLLQWISSPPANMTVFAATCTSAFNPIKWEGPAYVPLTEFDPQLVKALAKAEKLTVNRMSGLETQAYVEYLHTVNVTTKPWEELYQAGNGNLRTVLASATNFAI